MSIGLSRTLRRLGAAAIQIEDQVMPKRCGHLDGKQIVSAEEFVVKIRAAREARKSSLIVARTDSKAVYGMDEAVRRGRMYLEAGADIVFPEALESEDEFVEYARLVDSPLLANMTEFGKTPYLTVERFGELGYKLVIFPVTALRVAAKAMEEALAETLALGTQRGLLSEMQTRAELYELIRYSEYERMDEAFRGSLD